MTQANNPESSENPNSENNDEEQMTLEEIANEIGLATQAQEEAVESEDQPAVGDKALLEARQEIEKLKKEVASAQDKYLRSLADFENYKKRTLKERSELLKYQGEQLVIDLIRVIDDFDLAMQFANGQMNEGQSDPEKFRQGIELIYKGFCDVLKKWDIRAESSIGKVFDPVKNLAISRIYSPEAAVGTVVSELKKVFFYKDKLIRVGEVVVATEPPAENES